ncbi:ABC transporter ATP-binding protein [Clostridium sp. E02]|uniref:ABC transporter transmembrane domain-containing protein n=1 Tax=Clostridium sp. E02 TaxID=2487134 RepID=UPI000F53D2A9|nr:ABC transporter ATP-binding protein [Clostridium sp. E02]
MKNNWLLKGLLKYKISFLIAFILVGIDAVCTFLYPSYITNIVDIAIPYKDTQFLLENIILLLLVSLVSIFVGVNLNYLFYNASNNFVYDIKKKIVGGVFSYNGLKIRENTNKFMTCITEDTYMIEVIASQLIASTLLDVVTLIIIIIIMVRINVSILLFILITYPLLLILQYFFNQRIKTVSKEMMNMRDKSNSLIRELADFLYEYIVIDGENYFNNRFFPLESKIKDRKIDLCMLKTYNSFIPRLLNAIAFAVVVGFCAYKIISGELSIGGLTVIIMYIRQLSTTFVKIIMIIGEFQKIRISVKRIDEVIKGGQ